MSGVRIPAGSPNEKIPQTIDTQGFAGFFVALFGAFSVAQDCKNQHILALLSIVQPVKFLSKSREHTGKNKPGISSIKICLVANIYSMLFSAQAAAGMLYSVLDFGPLAVVEAVQVANQVAGDPADTLEGDLC